MARPSANLRLFVAIDPPLQRAQEWLGMLPRPSLPPHRLTPPEQIHLTLQFVGDTPARDLDRTIESVRRATGGIEPFELRPARLITLPERGRKRLIALETDAPPPLLELHRRLAIRLAMRTRRDSADRFRPHLTLCRFRSPSPAPSLDELVVRNEPYGVDRLRLMRSTLRHSGAVHHEIAAYALAGS